MNMPAFIGNIPSKGWLIIGGVTAGLIGWRLMSGSGGAQSPSNPAYDPALVALGTEAGLEKMRMSNELDTARLNADKELEMFRGQLAFEDKALTTTTSKELEMFRGELGLAETQSARDYNLSADKAGKDYYCFVAVIDRNAVFAKGHRERSAAIHS
jgi:hypothetical protein